MSAHVLLNSLNESGFRIKFYKLNDIGARMVYFIYNMTCKLRRKKRVYVKRQ